jgi:hypothetical protein
MSVSFFETRSEALCFFEMTVYIFFCFFSWVSHEFFLKKIQSVFTHGKALDHEFYWPYFIRQGYCVVYHYRV